MLSVSALSLCKAYRTRNRKKGRKRYTYKKQARDVHRNDILSHPVHLSADPTMSHKPDKRGVTLYVMLVFLPLP